MSKPEGILKDVWDAACEADAACQRNSCKEASCNGFLCVRALEIAAVGAVQRERAECLKIIENTAQGSLQANLALSLAYETIKKRGEVK